MALPFSPAYRLESRWVRPALLGAIGLLTAAAAPAAEVAGLFKTVKGTVNIERGGQRLPASEGLAVEVQDRVVSGQDGSAGITLRDSTLLAVGPNASLSLNRFAYNRATQSGQLDASVQKGTLAVVSGAIAKNSPGDVLFRTPTVTLGVRGTEFIIDAGSGR